VNAVGCLKYESGKCVLSCAQVREEVYIKNGISATVTEIGGRGAPHYCGPDAALEFEFSGVSLGGVVPLASGQMDKLATKPEWVCKPVKIPFVGVELDSLGIPTTDIQHAGVLGAPQNCIILSGKVSPILSAREGCFMPIKYDKSYDSIYFTPIIEYDSPAQVIYPSAIYVDSSFTVTLPGGSKPECDYRNPPNHRPVSDQEITDRINKIVNSPAVIEGKQVDVTYQEYYDSLASDEEKKKLVDALVANQLGDMSRSDDNLIGNVLNNCNFKTTYNGEKIKYSVWAKPVYPTIDALKDFAKIGDLQNFISGILGAASPELRVAFSYITAAGEGGTKLIFSQLGGSCTSVVLTRDLKDESIVELQKTATTQLAGRIVEMDTDKLTYLGGETVKLTGKIETYQGSDKEVEIQLDYGPLFLEFDSVVADNENNFEWNVELAEQTGSGKYKIIASYGGDEKEIEFNVS
jgi:hypothetical protein